MSSYRDWQQRIIGLLGLHKWRYDPINQTEGSELSPRPSSRSRFIKIAGGLAIFWIVVLALFSHHPEPIIELAAYNRTEASYFHVLLSANEGSPDLCKTLFSAAALDYPSPRLINWGEDYKDLDVAYGGAHIAKIEGILGYLHQLGEPSDHELALIVDGYDTWFQLRSSVLIDRYHAINERADRRVLARMGWGAMNKTGVPIRHSIVFAAQKRCYPATADDPECYAVPESDLPSDTYGPTTDRESDQLDSAYSKYRPRYLNSDTIMGTVKELRRTFEAALVVAKEMPAETGSDQGAFATIFGQQEYMREVIRRDNLTSWQNFTANFFPGQSDRIPADHPTHNLMEPVEGVSYEYGISLDYRGELSLPTVFSEHDAVWLEYSSASSIREAAQRAGVPAPDPPRVHHLSQDIKNSTPPFWTADYTGQTPVPDKDWSEVKLFTNVWTGISPVTIHHNSRLSGVKSRIRTSWEDTWFFPYLRDLLVTKAIAYRMPAAVSRGQEWWAPIDERGGFRVEMGIQPGHWLNWDADTVCGTSEIANEVLRDRRGPWKNPVYYLSWVYEEALEALDRWQLQETGIDDGQE